MSWFNSWSDFTKKASEVAKTASEKAAEAAKVAAEKSKTVASTVHEKVNQFVEEQKEEYNAVEQESDDEDSSDSDIEERTKFFEEQTVNGIDDVQQSPEAEDVMIDSGAVDHCAPKWFGELCGDLDEEKRKNLKVNLPWYLYWNGEADNQGRPLSFDDYAKRLADWAQKFKHDDRDIGLEVLL